MNQNNFKRMSFQQKCFYILKKKMWDIILGMILLLVLGTWVKTEFFDDPPVLCVQMIDASEESGDASAFQEFLCANGLGSCEKQVKVSKDIQVGSKPSDIKCNPGSLLFCLLQEEKTDLYFWNDEVTESAFMRNGMVDLRTVLSPEALEANWDRLIFTGPAVEGGFPYAIDLTGCDWIDDHGFYDQCYAAISRNAPDIRMAGQFLEYIL